MLPPVAMKKKGKGVYPFWGPLESRSFYTLAQQIQAAGILNHFIPLSPGATDSESLRETPLKRPTLIKPPPTQNRMSMPSLLQRSKPSPPTASTAPQTSAHLSSRRISLSSSGEHPCELSLDLLSSALQLFFSHTVVPAQTSAPVTMTSDSIGVVGRSLTVPIRPETPMLNRTKTGGEVLQTPFRPRSGTAGDSMGSS